MANEAGTALATDDNRATLATSHQVSRPLAEMEKRFLLGDVLLFRSGAPRPTTFTRGGPPLTPRPGLRRPERVPPPLRAEIGRASSAPGQRQASRTSSSSDPRFCPPASRTPRGPARRQPEHRRVALPAWTPSRRARLLPRDPLHGLDHLAHRVPLPGAEGEGLPLGPTLRGCASATRCASARSRTWT